MLEAVQSSIQYLTGILAGTKISLFLFEDCGGSLDPVGFRSSGLIYMDMFVSEEEQVDIVGNGAVSAGKNTNFYKEFNIRIDALPTPFP